jgi:hypothetical protein
MLLHFLDGDEHLVPHRKKLWINYCIAVVKMVEIFNRFALTKDNNS